MANTASSTLKVRLDSTNIKEYANRTVTLLRKEAPNPIPKAKLCKDLGLTIGQGSTLIKYMRRCSLNNFERFIPYYPISSKKGYTLPQSFEDFLPCFATLYLWTKSLSTTIFPMKQKLDELGVDIAKYIKSKGRTDEEDLEYSDIENNYLNDFEEINGDTSWFFERRE